MSSDLLPLAGSSRPTLRTRCCNSQLDPLLRGKAERRHQLQKLHDIEPAQNPGQSGLS